MKTVHQGLLSITRNFLLGAGILLVVALMGSQAKAAETSGTSPAGAGLQAASWLATIPYGAVKVAFALTGGIVGGLTWAVTGGNTEIAKTVWTTSMYGDYIVRPEHLTGEKKIRFLGESSEKRKP
jgi:hypothetical protein